jgi:putative endonuclease
MTATRKHLGRQGEALAIDFLKKNRYTILQKNYRCVFGEIDIIALKKNVLSFIEVKARTSVRFGLPQEAITARKQRKISRVALEFMQRYRVEDKQARFDVVAVQLTPAGPRIELIENAFELAE